MNLSHLLSKLSDLELVQEWAVKICVGIAIALLIQYLSKDETVSGTKRPSADTSRPKKPIKAKVVQSSSTIDAPAKVPVKTPRDETKTSESKRKTIKPKRILSTNEGKQEHKPPPFSNIHDNHPGLDAFHYWMDTEASLFRLYVLCRAGEPEDVPPYNPLSLRGKTSVKLEVANRLSFDIRVYWVNYKGNEEDKGLLRSRTTFHQHTWIDHPWVFRNASTNEILLHYIPYRVIPTTDAMPTFDPAEPTLGLHRFSITAPTNPLYACGVDDPVFPFPSSDYLKKPRECVEWSLLHCHRMGYSEWQTLIKYLTKILEDPKNPKYRQLRQANPVFGSKVWNTTARGVLFAAGFVENQGYAEIGTGSALEHTRIQELSWLIKGLDRWDAFNYSLEVQPEGADGYGRANFHRAGGFR